MQDKVELYLTVQPITLRDVKNEAPDVVQPAVYIRNVGSNVVYLQEYTFNGKVYPLGSEVLPPTAVIDGYRYVFLPIDGQTHVSLTIDFFDWCNRKWQTTGYADYKNRNWEITYSPAKKVIKGESNS